MVVDNELQGSILLKFLWSFSIVEVPDLMQELADFNLPLTMDIKPEKLKMKKLKKLEKLDKPKKKKKLKVKIGAFFTLKSPITTAADGIHKYFFIVFQRK